MKLKQGDPVVLLKCISFAKARETYEATYFFGVDCGPRATYYVKAGQGYFHEYWVRTTGERGRKDKLVVVVLTEEGELRTYPSFLVRKVTTKRENAEANNET